MNAVVDQAAMREHLVIPTTEFYTGFMGSLSQPISDYDAMETLTQVIDVLANEGRAALAQMDYRTFPDLNRMQDRFWKDNPKHANEWQDATRVMVLQLLEYLDALKLYDAQGEFLYRLTQITGTHLIFLYCPL